ncbi:unnamed protein product [Hymenolepis diminuta]|uniref:TPX2 domain-containing protein n=2 Tax=Hymenolepis diminuta TaxID=6216 RepID=A0A0R3SFX1_HYMDI|nr:unnamed protein product [Hymenolepis diminuta]
MPETPTRRIDSRLHGGLRFGGSFKANVTKPKPFSFEEKDRAIRESRKKVMEEEIRRSRRLASAFRARPMPNPDYVSIPDMPPILPPTFPKTPVLATRRRASRRASFDKHLSERRASAERHLKEIEQEKAKEAALQIAAERRAREFKAAPVRRIKLRLPDIERKPLTRSRAMSFRTDARLEARQAKFSTKREV